MSETDIREVVRERYAEAAQNVRKDRISIFISLPIRSLDRMALGAKIRDIGRLDGATPRATS
jgi:hypothetical protein